jgi:hypothetical protein
MDIQLLLDSIETIEHKDKKNYWLYFSNLYLTIIEKRIEKYKKNFSDLAKKFKLPNIEI